MKEVKNQFREFFRNKKTYPLNVELKHELNEDNPDKSGFCDIIHNLIKNK